MTTSRRLAMWAGLAAMAMQGMLSRDASRPDDASKEAAERFRRNVAREATRHADALLDALQANCGEAGT